MSFNVMAAVTVHSDFGVQENKIHLKMDFCCLRAHPQGKIFPGCSVFL